MATTLETYKQRFFIVLLLATVWTVKVASLTDITRDLLPHPCDSVKCPPLSEITCPDDSDIRESIAQNDFLQSSTATPLEDSANNSSTEVEEDLYAQCCLAKKCICRTCFIPGCNLETEVIVELQRESMNTPGRCCGQYDCQREPNCTVVRDTESYWLTNCQRCKCYSGERICHQSCDEGMKKPKAICNPKNLNRFFEHGDSWKDGCYECECVNGEDKCVMPFCKSVNCPTHRQVILKDSCCPICWPKGIPMPNVDEEYEESQNSKNIENDNNNNDEDDDDEHEKHHSGILENQLYDDEDEDEDENEDETKLNENLPRPTPVYAENDLDILPTIKFEKESNEATTKTPCLVDARQSVMPTTYQVYPEVVEVVRQTHQNHILYAVIGCLALVIVLLAVWNVHLRAKQRSYRPVSHIDDNFNKSSNIKKTKENDYA